jgi:hypothetical protein
MAWRFDASFVFWTRQTLDGLSGVISRYSLNTKTTVEMDSLGNTGAAFPIAAGGYIYWANTGIMRADDGFASSQIVIPPGEDDHGFSVIAVDGDYLYFANNRPAPFVEYALASGGPRTEIAPVGQALDVVAAAGAVFWLDITNNTIYGARVP